MKLILLTGNDCPVCDEVKEVFQKKYKEELDSGEAHIVNLDEDEEVQQFWMENDLPLAPTMFVVTEDDKLITILNPQELLEPAKVK